VARLAGDEFVIALEGLGDSAPAESLAEKIIEKMRAPFRIGDMELSVSTSIGVAISTDASESVDDLLKRADQALYRAKKGGRGRFEVDDLGK
jgi:diguanylate cyclase (GGDEF)-like protein